MSKATFWQRGEALDYKNNTASVIEANSIVVFGKRIGVIGSDIAPSQVGTIHVTSVFEMKKAAEEIAFGDTVYWDAENECITKTAKDIVAGYAAQDAAASEATLRVKLLG